MSHRFARQFPATGGRARAAPCPCERGALLAGRLVELVTRQGFGSPAVVIIGRVTEPAWIAVGSATAAESAARLHATVPESATEADPGEWSIQIPARCGIK
jgi:hypothetical protein